MKIGKANLRPAPNGSKFIIAPDEFKMYVKFKNPTFNRITTKISFIYDWTHIKANGENKKLYETPFFLNHISSEALIYGPFNSPKKKEYKTLAICKEHENGYDVIYTVEVKADN